jgi:hypothetical protein
MKVYYQAWVVGAWFIELYKDGMMSQNLKALLLFFEFIESSNMCFRSLTAKGQKPLRILYSIVKKQCNTF